LKALRIGSAPRARPGQPGAAGDSALLFEAFGRYALALCYGLLMIVNYQSLSHWWAYIGFDYAPLAMPTLVGLLLVSGIPAMLLARQPRSVAEFGAWILYFTLFMPAMIIPALQGWTAGAAAAELFLVVLASTILFILLTRSPARPFRIPRFEHSTFWIVVISLFVLLHGSIILSLGGLMSFAGFEQVYEQRSAAAEATNGLLAYVLSNTSGALNPFLIATGIAERKWWRVALGTVGQVIVYSTLAGKIVLVSILVIAGVFLLFDKEGRIRPMRMGLGLCVVALIGLPLTASYDPINGNFNSIIDLVYVRTLYLPGVLVGAYYDFFSQYPVTYFSHSIVGRAFVEYPYGQLQVGQVIGAYVTPSASYEVNDYNANFIAADGITSLGLYGIPFAILLAVAVLRLFDRLLGQIDFRVRCAALVPFLMWLADGSLLTALLTGGGISLTLLTWLWGGTRSPTTTGARDPLTGAGDAPLPA
jgi:hypothetical protein